MTDERRVHARKPVEVPATLATDGESVEGIIENIGQGGVFFATEVLEVIVDEGSQVTLRFTGEKGGESLEYDLAGTVLRAERYFDGTRVVRAFAVKFDDEFDLAASPFG